MKFSKLAILKVAASFFVLSRGGGDSGGGTIIISGVLAEDNHPAPHLRRLMIHPEESNKKQVVRGMRMLYYNDSIKYYIPSLVVVPEHDDEHVDSRQRRRTSNAHTSSLPDS